MLRFIIKALIILWPFLKNVVFKDRTTMEVLIDNKHITLMLLMVILMMLTIVGTVNKLASVNEHLTNTQTVLGAANEKITTLEKQLTTLKTNISDCHKPIQLPESIYDKSWIIESLKKGGKTDAP